MQELIEVEAGLQDLYDSTRGGFISPDTKEELFRLEERRRNLLEEKEVEWRLKSRAIWLEKGDENTKLFQAYAKGRKMSNTIWSLQDSEGRKISSFDGLDRLGKNLFQSLFKATPGASLEDIVRLALLFPKFVGEEENHALMEEVSEDELKEVLHNFQKDKIPGPNDWTIEFFLGFYDLIGKDILKLVEETRVRGHLHPPLNSNFIALIPKVDDPSSLNDFRPISLCNCIYKVVSKVIARRIKATLSEKISPEQFGFLEGRQIHEAIGVSQEVMHSLRSTKSRGEILKIDLSKSFDKVSWLYLRMLLTHLGFEVPFINWIMCCITSVSFVVLINGSASSFFHVQ
jgi:hypothetical protein